MENYTYGSEGMLDAMALAEAQEEGFDNVDDYLSAFDRCKREGFVMLAEYMRHVRELIGLSADWRNQAVWEVVKQINDETSAHITQQGI